MKFLSCVGYGRLPDRAAGAPSRGEAALHPIVRSQPEDDLETLHYCSNHLMFVYIYVFVAEVYKRRRDRDTESKPMSRRDKSPGPFSFAPSIRPPPAPRPPPGCSGRGPGRWRGRGRGTARAWPMRRPLETNRKREDSFVE